MSVSVQSILSQNITLLYDSLDLSPDGIDRNRLRRIGGDNAVVMDTDEMIVVIQQPTATILQLGDRRIRVTVQKPETQIGTSPIWVTAHQLHELVTKSILEAYGFNYTIAVELDEDGAEILQRAFIANRPQLEERLGGQLRAIVPHLRYTNAGINYDLNMEPTTGKIIQAHLNVHTIQSQLPSQNVLERHFKENYRNFPETLARLLEVEA